MMTLAKPPLANIPKNPDTLLSYEITHRRDTTWVSLFVIHHTPHSTLRRKQKKEKKKRNTLQNYKAKSRLTMAKTVIMVTPITVSSWETERGWETERAVDRVAIKQWRAKKKKKKGDGSV